MKEEPIHVNRVKESDIQNKHSEIKKINAMLFSGTVLTASDLSNKQKQVYLYFSNTVPLGKSCSYIVSPQTSDEAS